MLDKLKRSPLTNIPPILIIGAVLILAPIFVFLTVQTLHRQKENMTRILVEKGAALIRSFEAGTRTGMMGMMGSRWGDPHLQRLLTETAKQSDIVYLAVVGADGTIIAHSDESKIGEFYDSGLDLEQISHTNTIQWRQIQLKDGLQVLEVYRRFAPSLVPPHFRPHHGMMGGRGRRPLLPPEPPPPDREMGRVIFVGLDMGPIEAARLADARHTVFMTITLLFIGIAGTVTLYLSQVYRSTKRSLSRIQAFSDNLVENMPMGLIAVGNDGGIVSFNQHAETVLRMNQTEVLGKKAAGLLPESLFRFLAKLENGRKLVEDEISCRIDTDRIIPLQVIGASLESQEGDPLGRVILFRDLSEIQNLKEEIARGRRLAAIGRLAAGVAHEIRNPLSSIKGFATYFQDRYKDVPDDHRIAGIMIQEVERLNRVIGQLLDYARPMNVRLQPVSLGPLVLRSLELIESDARQKGIRIEKRISDSVKVQTDPDRINQVLLNLYLNAIESMEKGGVLTVALENVPDSGPVRISVTDTGKGIPEKDLAHVFDPYFTTKSTGTGLGLAIVHKIVEMHGGDVRVKSVQGTGTSVTVSLPASPFSDEG